MTPEEKIKDFPTVFITYKKTYSTVKFPLLKDAANFREWLAKNSYSASRSGNIVDFYKLPIHEHRIQDARIYPNLALGKEY